MENFRIKFEWNDRRVHRYLSMLKFYRNLSRTIARIMNFAIQMSGLIYDTQLSGKLRERIKRHNYVRAYCTYTWIYELV